MTSPRVKPLPVRRWEVIFAIALIVTQVALNAIYVMSDHRPPVEDSPDRIIESVRFWRELTTDHRVYFMRYPPLPSLVALPFYQVAGPSAQSACLSLNVFLAVYLASMIWIGRLWGGRQGGVLMGLAAAAVPHVSVWCRTYVPDVALLAAVALSMGALVGCSGLTRRRETWLLGASLAMGMLARWTFPWFMGLPFLVVVIQTCIDEPRERRTIVTLLTHLALTAAVIALGAMESVGSAPAGPLRDPHAAIRFAVLSACWLYWLTLARRQRPEDDDPGAIRPWAGLALALSTAVLGTLWWYAFAAGTIYEKLLMDASEHQRTGGLFLQNLAEYVAALSHTLPGTPLLIAVGTAAGLRMSGLRRPTALAVAGLAFSVGLLCASAPHADPRYAQPATVFVLILCLGWLARALPPRPLAWGAGTLMLGTACLVLTDAWVLPGALRSRAETLIANDVRVTTAYCRQPEAAPYPLRETLTRVLHDGQAEVGVIKLDGAEVEVQAFELTAALDQLPIRVKPMDAQDPGQGPERIIVIGDLSTLAATERLSSWKVITSWKGGADARWHLMQRTPASP